MKLKTEIKKSKEENYKNVIERITTKMNDKEICLVDISTQTGFPNWLTVLPITDFGFELSKQKFWDSIRLIRLRYGWKITNLPIIWSCTSKFERSLA